MNVFKSLGAFAKFATILSVAQQAVAFVAATMAHHANEDKKATAVRVVKETLGIMVEAGKIHPDLVEDIDGAIDDSIELAHMVFKHGPQVPDQADPVSRLFSPGEPYPGAPGSTRSPMLPAVDPLKPTL